MRATEIGIHTETHECMIDLTDRVRDLVAEQGWREGLLLLFVPHSTAGVALSENVTPGAAEMVVSVLQNVVSGAAAATAESLEPERLRASEANVKAVTVGNHVVIPILNGEPQLGRWQGIYFAEFNGPRDRLLRLYFLEG